MPRIRDLSPRVHRLGSSTVNWYLVEDQGRFTAVDAGMPGFKRSLEQDLAALGASPADVVAVILTHSDADHIGLARVLQGHGARILIHERDEGTLRKPGPKGGDATAARILRELWRPTLWQFAVSMLASGAGRIQGVQAAEVFTDGQVLDVPGHPRVIPTPGHTPGHCAFYFQEHRALFVGDALCSLNPITGARGPQLLPRAMNFSTDQALRSLDSLESQEADIVLFGHGEPWRDGVDAAVRMARERAAR